MDSTENAAAKPGCLDVLVRAPIDGRPGWDKAAEDRQWKHLVAETNAADVRKLEAERDALLTALADLLGCAEEMHQEINEAKQWKLKPSGMEIGDWARKIDRCRKAYDNANR